MSNTKRKAYIVTVDMGYGHQRAVHPLKGISIAPKNWDHDGEMIITANNYPGIPKSDRTRWEGGRSIYEKISRLKNLPLIGDTIFGIMDYFQRIRPFYPKKGNTKTTAQLKQLYHMIDNGWGKHLIDELNKNPLPYITSFFTTAFFAEEHGYKGDIYCICTDADISRAWAPRDPKNTRIHYFAPNPRVKERLQTYGIPKEKITLTGFPLPKSNIGEDGAVLKESLSHRLCQLDPNGNYRKKYAHTLEHYLDGPHCDAFHTRPLTITFAVGGAGAQREIGATILESLHEHIHEGRIKLNLVAGSRNDVYRYYDKVIKDLHLNEDTPDQVYIIYDEDKLKYFDKFNEILLDTDILWTKPSELSFYAGLGLPIIIAPTIGSQEDFNRRWLEAVGAGIDQEDPRYAHQWLFDWLESGWLAEAAMEGFLDAPNAGTYRIEQCVFEGITEDLEDTQIF